MAEFIEARVIGHQGIHGPGRDAPEQGRLTETLDVPAVRSCRLGNDCRFKTVLGQILADDGGADLGAVEVGVPGHQNDIGLLPAQGFSIIGNLPVPRGQCGAGGFQFLPGVSTVSAFH